MNPLGYPLVILVAAGVCRPAAGAKRKIPKFGPIKERGLLTGPLTGLRTGWRWWRWRPLQHLARADVPYNNELSFRETPAPVWCHLITAACSCWWIDQAEENDRKRRRGTCSTGGRRRCACAGWPKTPALVKRCHSASVCKPEDPQPHVHAHAQQDGESGAKEWKESRYQSTKGWQMAITSSLTQSIHQSSKEPICSRKKEIISGSRNMWQKKKEVGQTWKEWRRNASRKRKSPNKKMYGQTF